LGSQAHERTAVRRGIASNRTKPLGEPEIVEAALQIVAAVGVEGLTMRGLADRLGVSVAAAYKHVPDKQALLHLACDNLLSRVEEGDVRDGDCLDRIRAFMINFYDVMRTYSGMSAYLALRPEELPRLRMTATMRHILEEAGFSVSETWDIMMTLHFFATGALLGPMAPMGPHDARAEVLRDIYCRGLEMVLDGLRVRQQRTPN
jgi:AcrR family transcriptional regulator